MDIEEIVKNHGQIIEKNSKSINKMDKRLIVLETETKLKMETIGNSIDGIKDNISNIYETQDRTETKVDIISGKVDQFNADTLANNIAESMKKNKVVINMEESKGNDGKSENIVEVNTEGGELKITYSKKAIKHLIHTKIGNVELGGGIGAILVAILTKLLEMW